MESFPLKQQKEVWSRGTQSKLEVGLLPSGFQYTAELAPAIRACLFLFLFFKPSSGKQAPTCIPALCLHVFGIPCSFVSPAQAHFLQVVERIYQSSGCKVKSSKRRVRNHQCSRDLDCIMQMD